MELNQRLSMIAAAPFLLVACDFDGTVAPIVSVPGDARMDPRCRDALNALGMLRRTRVALVSGRSLAWLSAAAGLVKEPMLYGSHGAECSEGQEAGHDAELVRRLNDRLKDLEARWPGVQVEVKPFGAAVHFRRADPAVGGEVLEAARAVASEFAGLTVKLGSMVVELTTSDAHKGDAVSAAKLASGASHTVFFGDDVTDEDAFAGLAEVDLGVKVGPGSTVADARVADVAHVAAALETLVAARRAHLASSQPVPLQNHSLLSDFRTAAIVSPDADIAWLCLPRVDSPAMFAGILGGPQAGGFSIRPSGADAPPSQCYEGASMVLRTTWPTLTLVDYLDCSAGRPMQKAGRTDLVRVMTGSGKVHIVFAPRVDFGRLATPLSVADGFIDVPDAHDPAVLVSPDVDWNIIEHGSHQTAEACVDLDAIGGKLTIELRYGTQCHDAPCPPEPERRQQTVSVWEDWAARLTLPVLHRQAVLRSAVLLKALTHGPSGAILAAATTSLPEQLGGVRNWDYRYCWPRDASMAATSLLRLGSKDEAIALADWFVGLIARMEEPGSLRPLYTVTGEDLPPEGQINELCGYDQSRPVRLSNAAAQQTQLDVFGPIADMLATMAERGVPVCADHWRLVDSMVEAVGTRWREPDHGIWEIRSARCNHVHSRLMCWRTVSRALAVHSALHSAANPAWEALRSSIADDIFANGWNDRVGAFTVSYGSADVDATALQIGLHGLIRHDDPRWASTVDAVQRELRRGNTVLRYRYDDGLPGRLAGSVICTCWLVESLVTLGRIDEASGLLEAVLAQAGPTGNLTEQFDGESSTALGNLPQAYSHLSVINAVLRLENARPPRST